MQDLSESVGTVARVQAVGWQARNSGEEPLYAKSSEEEAAKRQKQLVEQVFPGKLVEQE